MMDGRSGATNGTRILTQMATVSNKGRHGGKASMESSGIALGGKATTDLDGFTNMERAAAVNIGTPMSSKTPGTRDSHTMVSITALITLSS